MSPTVEPWVDTRTVHETMVDQARHDVERTGRLLRTAEYKHAHAKAWLAWLEQQDDEDKA